jgi:hypothetical protein
MDVCENGFVRACTPGFTGFMDTKGNWLIKPIFLQAGVFVDTTKKHCNLSKTFRITEYGYGPRSNDFR